MLKEGIMEDNNWPRKICEDEEITLFCEQQHQFLVSLQDFNRFKSINKHLRCYFDSPENGRHFRIGWERATILL
jgi:predicted transcriptional regulator